MSGLDNPQGEQANRPYIQFLFFSSLKVVNVKQTYDTCMLQKNKLIIIIIIAYSILKKVSHQKKEGNARFSFITLVYHTNANNTHA